MATATLLTGVIKYGVNPKYEKEGNYGPYNTVKVTVDGGDDVNIIVKPNEYNTYTQGTTVALEQNDKGYYKIKGVVGASAPAATSNGNGGGVASQVSQASSRAPKPFVPMTQEQHDEYMEKCKEAAEKLADLYSVTANVFEGAGLFAEGVEPKIASPDEFRNLVVSLFIQINKY